MNEPVANPASLTFEQQTEASTWVIETRDALPFDGFARKVEAFMPEGAITDTNDNSVFDLPWSIGAQSADGRDVHLNWSRPVKGRARYSVRMD